MSKSVRRHSGAFRAKVALVAIKGDETVVDLASRYGGTPDDIVDQAQKAKSWKGRVVGGYRCLEAGKVSRVT